MIKKNLHPMPFHLRDVNYDACYKEGVPTLKKIKFTTCVANQFTCNDGECIDIEQRYTLLIK